MALIVTIATVETDDTADAPAGGDRLDLIEGDLADVEVALARLDAGTYWVDEVTGADLPAELLDAHPTARRAAEA
jgi:RNA polymerase-binding transcription factor DksA